MALHVLALTKFATEHIRPSSNCPCHRCAELEQELHYLREELRIKDTRMESISPRRRPDYEPHERFDVLALRALSGWPKAETARRFFVTEPTIRFWIKRVHEKGDEAFISAGPPVNRFPDLVGDIVRRLQQRCPELGKRSIASFLARCGLHLRATAVDRFLNERLVDPSEPSDVETKDGNVCDSTSVKPTKARAVTAKYPNHFLPR